MKPIIALAAASTILLAAGAAQALTLENRSGEPAQIQFSAGGQSQTLRVPPERPVSLPCGSQCQIAFNGETVRATDDDTVVISPQGELQKTRTR